MESKAERKVRESGNFFMMSFYISAAIFISGIVILMMISNTLVEYGLILVYGGIFLLGATMFGLFACALQEEFGIIKKALKIECPEE